MARVSVLYIRDQIAGPHLELLRNICEPKSKAKPHVTVRFFERLQIPPDHLTSQVTHIDLLEPASFGLESDSKQKNRTVFIRCHSDDLLPLEHKPYFPTSEFHITLYDGESATFAASLLRLLRRFRWGFRVNFAASQALEELPIKRKHKKSKAGAAESEAERTYTSEIFELYQKIFGKEIAYETLLALTDRQRINAARRVCAHFEWATSNFERIEPAQRILFDELDNGLDTVLQEPEIHLTPPELAQSIAAYATSMMPAGRSIDFGDPAVGTGAFFAAVLSSAGRRPINSAIGIDISAKQAEAANWRWREKGLDVRHGDYLHMERMPARNLVLANPPYLRHQQIEPKYKLELRQRASVILGRPISGLAGQYVYFLLLSHKWMSAGAIAAWLIPAEFMRARYGDAVRHYLTHDVSLIRVHQYGDDDPQFENARVLPAVVVFKNVPPKNGHRCLLTADGTLGNPNFSSNVEVEALRNLRMWSIPLEIENFSPGDVRIGDLFDVKRGIATGANKFFILRREDALRLGLPESCLKPILPRTRDLPGAVIERAVDGYPDLIDQMCVIDTSLPEEKIKSLYPRLHKYLESAKHSDILSRNLVGSRKPWYRQEYREPAPFVCTYMGRETPDRSAIRFYRNKSQAIATNAYLMLYPKPKLASKLEKAPQLYDLLFEALNFAAGSSVTPESRRHADGLEKIEPGDLKQVVLKRLPSSITSLVPQMLL